MTISVHTNKSALTALQNLNKTNTDLASVQNRVNTGLKIGNAKDNAAVWAIAQGQRADIGALGARTTASTAIDQSSSEAIARSDRRSSASAGRCLSSRARSFMAIRCPTEATGASIPATTIIRSAPSTISGSMPLDA